MKDKYQDDDLFHEERRLADVLAAFIALSGKKRRALEEELGLSSAGMSKILRGTVRLQVHHILRILEKLETHPSAFFRAAYPVAVPSKLGDRYAQSKGLDRQAQEAFNERVRQALLELLGVTAPPEAHS